MTTVPVDLYIEDPATALELYQGLRLFKDTSPDGDFSATVGSDATLDEDTTLYTIDDTTWAAGTWYRYAPVLIGGLSIGPLSPAWQVNASTLAVIRSNANRGVGGGWDSVCTADGDASALIDAALGDSARGDDFGEGVWIYRPDASDDSDRVRRVGGYTLATNALVPTRAWQNAPAEGERYGAYHFLPPIQWPGSPYSWDEAIREGINAFAYIDQVDLGVGTLSKTFFDLAPYVGWVTPGQLRGVYLRTFTDTTATPPRYVDVDASKNGRYWDTIDNGPGNLQIRVSPAPSANNHVILEVVRQYSLPYGDDDISDCPTALAIAAARWGMFHYLNSYLRPGKFGIEEGHAWEDAVIEASRVGSHPFQMVIAGL